MPAPKIVTFRGKKYFECMWTGVKLETCYALPEYDVHAHRSKGGSFADAACAIAYLNTKLKDGKTKEKKLLAIAQDLDLGADQELLEAPECPPIEEYDFSYRRKFPWMHQPNLYLTVEEVLAWKEEEEKPEKPEKRKVLIYNLKGQPVEPPYNRGSIVYSEKFDGIIFSDNSGSFNTELEDLTGVKAFGEAVIILSKPPEWTKDGKGKRGAEGDGGPRRIKVNKI